MAEILTPDEMGEADRMTIAAGPLDGYGLMLNAGRAVAAQVLARFPGAARVDVLCGPGNNGGDGYVVARLLAESGVDVRVWALGEPRAGSDAERAARACPLPTRRLADYRPEADALVVDALFGAGLSKPLEGEALAAVTRVGEAGVPVVAIDLPSGIDGRTGAVLGAALRAPLTITFARKKPGHLLYPGREFCGEVVVAGIGIPDAVIASLGVTCAENGPELWRLPAPATNAYKYSRGHVGVFCGGPASTGAARLSAMAAARAGAGAVTLLSPAASLLVNAAHLTSIILRKADTLDEAIAFLRERKPAALVYGPGRGTGDEVAAFALDLLSAGEGSMRCIVLDADALTTLARCAGDLFRATRETAAQAVVLTPHDGEFARLFPDLAGLPSKLDRAREAAVRAHCVVVLKGPDTVIAAPDGRAAINVNGTPLLAAAGSGDVLSGMVPSLAAQGMPAFDAASAAVWLHAEAARRVGPGLMAEDLPGMLPTVLRDLAGA